MNIKYKLLYFSIFIYSFLQTQLSAQEIRLKFNKDKIFKIVQFTDLHFYIGGHNSPEVIKNINYVMNIEKPDLVVLTGDVVAGDNLENVTLESWELITDLFIKYKTPYAVTFGNHDDELQLSRLDILDYLLKRPFCMISSLKRNEIKGVGNYILPIYNDKETPEKLIYCIDSRTYSLSKNVEGYGWIDRSQIEWFANTNKRWLKDYPQIQSLLFFHIPLPEYKQAFFNGEYTLGVRMEEECVPKINTGMYAEMVIQDNVLGVFVGHDHNNNYIAQLNNIALCYGHFSGGNSYHDLPLNGARVIVVEESKRTFQTWLRQSDGKILYKVELPYEN